MASSDRSLGRRWFPEPDCKIATFNIGLLFPGFDLDVQILAGFPLDLVPHRVVPVRFARAVSGFADASAPDIDDHGYTICPGGPTQGPTVGVASRALIRVKVMRDRIADDTDLFVSIDDASVATIEFPPDGTALSSADIPADGTSPARQADCVFLRGGASNGSSRSTTLNVHFDAAAGPVVAKLTVFQHPVLVVPMQLHEVTINDAPPRVGNDYVLRVVGEANKILAQAGVRLQPLTDLVTDDVKGFGIPGMVNIGRGEATIIFNTNPQPSVLNAYFFRTFFDNTKGLANAPRFVASAKTGFLFCTEFHNQVIVDEKTAGHTMAHELGHVLGLEHVGNGQEGTPDTTRQDIWSHRSVMFNRIVIEPAVPRSSAARVQVGYGARPNNDVRAGSLLTSKQRSGIPLSGEVSTVRSGVVRKLFLP